jgi:hypothetical protein
LALHHVVLSKSLFGKLHLIFLVTLNFAQDGGEFLQRVGEKGEQEGFKKVLIKDLVPTLREVRAQVSVEGLEHL